MVAIAAKSPTPTASTENRGNREWVLGLIGAAAGAACVIGGVYRDFQVLKRTAQCTIAERRTPELSADQQFRTAASFQTWRLHAPLSDVKTTSPVVIYSAESNTVTYTDSAYKFMADIITNCAQRSGRTFTRARHATLDS